MKKIVIIAASLVSFGFAAKAQTTSTAQQTVNLNLTDAIELVFVGSGTATGAAVTMPFTTISDYTNGVSSAAQQMRVRSNKKFNVTVKANAANFTYTGSATPTPTMPVSGVLGIIVSQNGTSGTIASPFSAATYATLTSAAQAMINNGVNGNNQTFSVTYKGTPGFNYPGGNYAVDVVYTATQP